VVTLLWQIKGGIGSMIKDGQWYVSKAYSGMLNGVWVKKEGNRLTILDPENYDYKYTINRIEDGKIFIDHLEEVDPTVVEEPVEWLPVMKIIIEDIKLGIDIGELETNIIFSDELEEVLKGGE
jgi:hypothetical protein